VVSLGAPLTDFLPRGASASTSEQEVWGLASRVAGVGSCQKPKGGVEVKARDGDVGLVLVGGSGSVLDAEYYRPLAHIGDVGAGHALGRARKLAGEAVGRQLRVQFEPAKVVLEYVGAPALVRQAHPHYLIEASWAAQCRVDVLGAVGGGEDENLTAFFDAVEEDEELSHYGYLVLGTLAA
jgi:hypothetical protein